MNENMLNPEDEHMVIEGIKIHRTTFKIEGCYRDNVFIDEKDMNEQEKLRAHDIMRKHTFDIVGEENKGG